MAGNPPAEQVMGRQVVDPEAICSRPTDVELAKMIGEQMAEGAQNSGTPRWLHEQRVTDMSSAVAVMLELGRENGSLKGRAPAAVISNQVSRILDGSTGKAGK